MATGDGVYTSSKVKINDKRLSNHCKVTLKRTSGSQPVKTVGLGYAGESQGSAMCEITVENAVPSTDFELDPGKFMGTLKACKITIEAAGRTLTTTGQIHEDNFDHAVDAEAKLSFSFRGRYADWR